MITIDNIIEWSKPHPVNINTKHEARMSRFGNDRVEFSIVGGAPGLYGDFKNNFEVAILDPKTKNFITQFFYDKGSDDVIPYMKSSDVENLVNSIIKEDELSVVG